MTDARDHAEPPRPGRLARAITASMRYPNSYVWLVFVSSMDIMVTWKIIYSGGTEVNPIANKVIAAWGLPGAIVFKFGLMMLVILICEYIGARRDQTGRWLAKVAVLISALPVAYSLTLLSYHIYFGAYADPAAARAGHERAWHDGSGRPCLHATMLGPELNVPVRDGQLVLGPLVFPLGGDVRPRERIVQDMVMGEA